MKIKAHCPFLGHTGYNAHTRGFFTALSDLVDLRVDNFTWCDDRHNYLTEQQKRIISEITLTNSEGEAQYPPDWKKEIEGFEYDVDIVLHEHNHAHFWRDYKKPKIAYTVWETDLYDVDFFKKLLQYDELWVPSEWQKECSVTQGYPEDRVKVVPEAVEPDCFPDKEIVPDDSIFTFCLLGRWDNRKSTTEILECFVELFGNEPNVQLIASIDNPYATDGLSTQERLKSMGWGNIKNIILKSFPSRPDYIDILRRSHVFLSCARSEGWNIPLIEAMACGIPSVYSDCSGQTEFASGKGIPIRILGKELARVGDRAVASPFTSKMPGHYYTPDFTHLKKEMRMCMDKYNSLKKKALQESIEIRSKFTWENAARIAFNHLGAFRPKSLNFKKRKMEHKILLPLITYGGMCHTEFAMGVMGTLLQIQKSSDINMVVNPIVFESLISRARNAAAAFALQDDFSHLLFIDSDITFESNDVFKLIEADKDVAVGVYPKKYYSTHKMQHLAQHEPHVFNDKNEWRALATDFCSECGAKALDKARRGEIFTVDYAATGFMLIKTDVFRKIIDKHPELKYTNDVDGYMSAGDNFYDFFTVGVNQSNKKYESEDYGFCQLWRSLGGQIHVIPSINLTHTGRNHYPGNIQAQAKIYS